MGYRTAIKLYPFDNPSPWMKFGFCTKILWCVIGHARMGAESMEGHIVGGSTPVGLQKRHKTGGRQKGTPNKRTAERQAALAAIKASGKSPMAFFADLLGNEQAPVELRFQAAKELAPYVHPRLASIESRSGGKTHEDRLEELRKLLDEDD